MLVNNGKKITMDVGDYGLPLVMKIVDKINLIKNTDTITFSIKKGDEIVIRKEYSDLQTDENNKFYFVFSLTKEESEKLVKGNYVYEIEANRDGAYLNTLMKNGLFLVE